MDDKDKKFEKLTANDSSKFVVNSDKVEEFIDYFNKNVISEEFLKECRETTSLFKKNKKVDEYEIADKILEEVRSTPVEILKEALEEVKLMREGKIEKKNYWDAMKELEEEDDE